MVAGAVLGALLFAGCASSTGGAGAEDGLPACPGGAQTRTFYVQPDGSLAEAPPANATAVAVPGVTNGFVSDQPRPFLSAPLPDGLRIDGDVTMRLWLRSKGGTAPIVVGGAPGEGYHLFAQYGSDVALAPTYIVEYGPAVELPGTVRAYDVAFAPAKGGFVVESGDRVRLLVTSLVTDQAGTGHDVLVGGETSSRLEFQAVCLPPTQWSALAADAFDVSLPGNQGLLTGVIPPIEDVNTKTVNVTLDPGAGRVTIQLRAASYGEPKDDIDMSVVAANGTVLWNGGSPAVDETVVLYRSNLEALGLVGAPLFVRIDSYSGIGYTGTLSIVQEAEAE